MGNSITVIKNLERERAKFAFDYVKKINEKRRIKFKSHVQSFPMLVKTNGLGASVVFLFSKRDKKRIMRIKTSERVFSADYKRTANIKIMGLKN